MVRFSTNEHNILQFNTIKYNYNYFRTWWASYITEADPIDRKCEACDDQSSTSLSEIMIAIFKPEIDGNIQFLKFSNLVNLTSAFYFTLVLACKALLNIAVKKLKIYVNNQIYKKKNNWPNTCTFTNGWLLKKPVQIKKVSLVI